LNPRGFEPKNGILYEYDFILKLILKSFSYLVIILFMISAMPFAIAEYDENVGELIENDIEFKTYSDDQNYSINYPSFWSVNDIQSEYDAEPGIDDGGLNFGGFEYSYVGTSSRLGIYTLYNHISAGYDEQSYLGSLENLITDNCTNGETYFGYSCSNLTIIELGTVEIDGKTWYQITYSFDAVYPDDDSSIIHHRNILTETIVDGDLWGIESTNLFVNDNTQYAMPLSAFENSINSFKFIELPSTNESVVTLSDNIVSVSNFQITDFSGNNLDDVIFGDKILIEVELTNNLDVVQEFVYNVTYENEYGVKSVHPFWIQGNLPASYSFSAALAPEFPSSGEYTLTVEILNNNDEKITIAPTTTYSLIIKPDPNSPIESTNVPLEPPVILKNQIASFVDTTKDPQHYVDRYNTEKSYKEWFDANYSKYDSIYQAVGLDEPVVVPEIPIYSDYDPDQHRLFGIIDGMQSYQNTEYGFTIDFPSPMFPLTNFPSSPKSSDVESIVQFSGYPPIGGIMIKNYPDYANSIDDKKYLENLEEKIINFDDALSYGEELSSPVITSSEIISIDNHKAYQVISETTLDIENPKKSSATKTVIITDIIHDDDILSVTITNFELSTDLDTSTMTLLSPLFTNEQLIGSLDSLKFTAEKPSKKYVNSDTGFEITLLDDWTIRDYGFVSNLDDLIEGSTLEDNFHESLKHIVSSVKIFPDNSSHMPKTDTLNVDVGTKDNLFVNQSPTDFLSSYQNKHYELMNEIGSISCDLLSPQPSIINGLDSFQSEISCDELDEGKSTKITYTLFLTKDHFVLVYFTDRPSLDQLRYIDDISTMMESIEINEIFQSENNSMLQLDPEPAPTCGAGTESVNGICQTIKIPEESFIQPSFFENIFGFFKNLFN
jgi:hypothetical protein